MIFFLSSMNDSAILQTGGLPDAARQMSGCRRSGNGGRSVDHVFITVLPPEAMDSREAVVRYLAQVAGQGDTALEAAICASALERETAESTYIGRGLAVPHARVADLTDAVVCMTSCPEGVDWNGETATFIALTAVPETRPELHLQLLSALARYFSAHRGETPINAEKLATVLGALFR